jgi:serine protease Do
VARSLPAVVLIQAGASRGTGFFVKPNQALTNAHVVGTQVSVELQSGNVRQSARVVSVSPGTDLALLEVFGPNAGQATLPLGSLKDVRPGQEVVAIGSPFGVLSNTVTRGIVSAVGRDIVLPSGDKLAGLIQIDAAINPGSSGGPLLNVYGELIGINVAMRDGAQLIAFAIPSDTVKGILSQHLSAKKLVGVDHGLACTEVVTKAEGPDRQRVKVTGLDEKGLANGSIRPGDYLVQVADRSVTNRFDLERALWDLKPGSKIPVVVDRAGEKVAVTLSMPGKAAPLGAARR